MKQSIALLIFSAFALTHSLAGAASDKLAHGTDKDGFRYPVPGGRLEFPRDHGSHPEYKSEWWYITGHIKTTDTQQKYGFQITFFRSATSVKTPQDQIYMAHAALTDLKTGKFLHEERINQAGWNADASEGSLDVFNGNWSLKMTDPQSETMQTRFSIASEAVLNLELRPTKPITLFGDNGYSKKGSAATAASYYATFTRLALSGSLKIDGRSQQIVGYAWMDHEFSSSQLHSNQIGWNWTSLILDDGTELMAYVMRRSDGQSDPHSKLTLIDEQGDTRTIPSDSFTWTPLRHWKSPYTAADYPVDYEITWSEGANTRRITVKTNTDDQELQGRLGNFQYWEGSGTAFDANGLPIGSGYTELTGYNGSLEGRF